ncbi:EamA family transporter [Edwardsiella ictaluri]|uniref:EamA family transporter n=1 Tax=Edwardsiella ictaluri TaxID=67780 RepID=UPI0009BF88F9|nr:EamA family transporter [Edwardsiella ictaluri]ARD40803.1 EamA family transporter [Edwardsiella ictaluri]QPW26355.1 EamA family transporter [Edwardsiella ictaluri]QPW29638.1 EamA family transporter [Edwardsiella ictaluri]WJH20674.1 EamA family transporter [Edwardsiella ictaluri]BEH98428.1 EamA family transporter [Edwardsiella ictaluri]
MGSLRQGMGYVLVAAALWGSSGVCAQYILQKTGLSAQWLTMFRLTFSGVILLVVSFLNGDRLFAPLRHRRDIVGLLWFTLLGAIMVQLTFLMTIERSNAATATILQFLSPTIIVAWFAAVRRQRPGLPVMLAIGSSLGGTFLLVTHGDPTSLLISRSALFWGIASAFASAFYTTYPSGLIARFGTLPIVGWSMLLGGLMLMPFFAGETAQVQMDNATLLAAFYLVIIGTALTFSLYLKGAQIIGGARAGILSCTEPLCSALLSLLLLGITFGALDWLGTLLITASVVLISCDARAREGIKLESLAPQDGAR